MRDEKWKKVPFSSKSGTDLHRTKNSHGTGNKKHKKKKAVLPFITTPLIFVLISLIIILPLFIGFTGFAVRAVHTAQKTLTADYYDKSVSTQRYDSNQINFDDYIGACEKVGVLSCESAGIKTDVFYGINRVSLRNGAAVSTESSFPGKGGEIDVAGYASTAFKGLKNVGEGDSISFETNSGIYRYKVTSASVSDGFEKPSIGEFIVLSTSSDINAFSSQNKKKRYVVAVFSDIIAKEEAA